MTDTFHAWCQAAEAVRATTKRLEKSAVLEAYFPTLDDASLAVAARFLSGVVFPRHDMRTTQVGGAIVFGALAAVTGLAAEALHDRYVALGDVGDLARAAYDEVFPGRAPSGLTLPEVEAAFAGLAATAGSNAKRERFRAAVERLGALEAQYFVKLALGSGELRIGLKEAQVEEALARAFGRPLAELRRANLLRGDVGEVAVRARHGTLGEARLALFHPIGFMLAQPLATAEEIAAALPPPFAVEDKYDGIRAQAHVGRDEATGELRVALYSRTLDEITRGYPEVVEALRAIHERAEAGTGEQDAAPAACSPLPASAVPPSLGLVLDGELLAFAPDDPERALPFKAFQTRLGRKAPSAALCAEVPVSFVAYDVLAAGGELVVDESYADRRARLERVPWPEPSAAADGDGDGDGGPLRTAAGARLAPVRMASTADEVERAFVEARERGNEGIIVKDPASCYAPGRRGKTWIKLKKAMATLDVVVTGVERGHGRRRGVLSDYTFAVRASETDPTLLNVGKAYNGLTDAEIAELTGRFEALTVERYGRYHVVRPEVVLEVTFDVVQRSARHKAGYALRFPRIVRVRDDKPASEVDTLARVKELAGE
jgi:DNA ligase-1